MKFAFTRPSGSVSIALAEPKCRLEQLFGEMTQEQYEAHVIERLIPKDALELVRLSDDWEPPTGRDLRHTWRLVDGKVVSVA